MANITLNTKVYNGVGILNGIAQWFERSGGLAGAFSSLTASVVVGFAKSKSRVHWKIGMPVVAAEASACACPGDAVRRLDADINVRLDSTATLAERTDFALRLKDLVATTEFQQSIINFQQPTG